MYSKGVTCLIHERAHGLHAVSFPRHHEVVLPSENLSFSPALPIRVVAHTFPPRVSTQEKKITYIYIIREFRTGRQGMVDGNRIYVGTQEKNIREFFVQADKAWWMAIVPMSRNKGKRQRVSYRQTRHGRWQSHTKYTVGWQSHTKYAVGTQEQNIKDYFVQADQTWWMANRTYTWGFYGPICVAITLYRVPFSLSLACSLSPPLTACCLVQRLADAPLVLGQKPTVRQQLQLSVNERRAPLGSVRQH